MKEKASGKGGDRETAGGELDERKSIWGKIGTGKQLSGD